MYFMYAYRLVIIQNLDKKYWQLCCHTTMVSSRAASSVDMIKNCQMSQCSQRRQYSYQSTAVSRTLTIRRDSAIALRPCLQKQSCVPESKLQWHQIVLHKNIFRDYLKHLTMQRFHIAQWHDELKRSGKAGMQFRIISVQDDPTSRTATVFTRRVYAITVLRSLRQSEITTAKDSLQRKR